MQEPEQSQPVAVDAIPDSTSAAGVSSVAVSSIIDRERVRRDYGDIQGLMDSIKRYGIIQPIVLVRRDGGTPHLVAGGRRLEACRRLRIDTLEHAKHFVWREELQDTDGKLRLQAVELEENLRRSDLHWSEVILGKKRLLDTMQALYGASRGFGGGRTGAWDKGFGVRTLAAMLGENNSITSRDLALANFVEKHPLLVKLPTKADAQRKLGVATTIAVMQNIAKKSTIKSASTTISAENAPAVGAGVGESMSIAPCDSTSVSPAPLSDVDVNSATSTASVSSVRWVLHEGRFQDNIHFVDDASVDLVLTDLPYNIGLGDSSAAHGAGLGGFTDTDIDIAQLCADVATQSFRVLRDNRFAVFFYGMNYHGVLYDCLTTAGFDVDPYPFIWIRDRTAPPDGFARYSKSFDPAMVARKGNARFVRPNLPNVLQCSSVRGSDRLHAAQKPVEVMKKFILDTTVPDCIILDMFAGSGTTGVAAIESNRKSILFEMEKQNCLIARSRLSTTSPDSGQK